MYLCGMLKLPRLVSFDPAWLNLSTKLLMATGAALSF